MAKRLVDIDEAALAAARAQLGTPTIKDTVNAALRLASGERAQQIAAGVVWSGSCGASCLGTSSPSGVVWSGSCGASCLGTSSPS